jgi:hypothetical protein
LPTWHLFGLLTTDCFWTTCSLRINSVFLFSLVMLGTLLLVVFLCPFWTFQTSTKSFVNHKSENPHQNLQISFKKTFMNRLSPCFHRLFAPL